MAVLIEHRDTVLQLEDVVLDARGHQVLTLIPARPVQDEPSGRLQYVLFAVEAGERQEIGRYTLDHTAMRDA
jgi:hypothetical protein